jgi:hypothetical protein
MGWRMRRRMGQQLSHGQQRRGQPMQLRTDKEIDKSKLSLESFASLTFILNLFVWRFSAERLEMI